MLSSLITYLPIALVLGLMIVTYRIFSRRVAERSLTVGRAAALFWLIALVAPAILAWLSARLGFSLFRTFPSLREPSWDVSLAFGVYFGMFLGYAVTVLAAILACWHFVVVSKRGSDERAT